MLQYHHPEVKFIIEKRPSLLLHCYKKDIKRNKKCEQVTFCYDRKEFPLVDYAERGLHSIWFFMSISLVKEAPDSCLDFMGQLTLKQKHYYF